MGKYNQRLTPNEVREIVADARGYLLIVADRNDEVEIYSTYSLPHSHYLVRNISTAIDMEHDFTDPKNYEKIHQYQKEKKLGLARLVVTFTKILENIMGAVCEVWTIILPESGELISKEARQMLDHPEDRKKYLEALEKGGTQTIELSTGELLCVVSGRNTKDNSE